MHDLPDDLTPEEEGRVADFADNARRALDAAGFDVQDGRRTVIMQDEINRAVAEIRSARARRKEQAR